MKHIFLDTNVLIDFLADRKPFSEEAAKLFNYSFQKKVTIYVATVSYNNIYYILRQSCAHSKTIKILAELQEWTESVDLSKDVIRKALKSDFKDFEDAIQYNCAKTLNKIDCLVTRDTKDFKTSSLPILTPKEAVTMIESTSH
ncbi:type II toxin-antitoxin system VapC family toxin [Solitalea koreensis]|uniref:Predicted nucleic acid-binding protein, contains PIN domain n=1 Tax=Solitalea koreensis TaxID=543615 RepID=A0A521DCN3_9SPHI|nr:PIN domain-containing protein [Solitalea koreensis]SMO69433.1 Predicted nucleic acid-binding protein, contains PIN domain [Solitalea koreensis]